MTNTIKALYQQVLQQMASESYLEQVISGAGVLKVLGDGNNYEMLRITKGVSFENN